jgi:hypothetical protein
MRRPSIAVPRISPPSPDAASRNPTQSSGGVSSLISGMNSVARMMPRMPMGMLTKKIQRQSV